MRRVCVFDVNETLLDLSALDAPFEAAFGRPGLRGAWFGQMLASMMVSTIIGRYRDFGSLAVAALDGLAEREGVTLDEAERGEIIATVRRLPPHPDVVPGLDRLRDAGFRLATLTNSTHAVATDQLDAAGIADRFEAILSADSVQRLKPAPEPYLHAASELDVPVEGIRMVAAHIWDIAGAVTAGAAGAFVMRPGVVRDPGAPPASIVGADIDEVARRIIEEDEPA